MSKSDLMKWAHRWAREHREEFPRYADALSVGMKKAHAHKGEMEKAPQKEIRFSDLSRRGVPLLLQNWLDPAYPYRKDFREMATPPRDRGMRDAREGVCL
jgi:hypothetical protein